MRANEIINETLENELYHVTHTKHVPNIQKNGLLPMGAESNWVQQGSGERYGMGEIYMFTNKEDANKWAGRMDWDFNQTLGSGEISIITFSGLTNNKFEKDDADPMNQAGQQGEWLKTYTPVPPQNIVKIEVYNPKKLSEANGTLNESPTTFYHGSMDDLPVGTILTPGEDDYEDNWGRNMWFHALEKYRPQEYRQHSWSVFMVDNDEDVDLAGGGTEYIFTVEPIGSVEKHDLNWVSELGAILDDGEDINSNKVKQLALNYWNGVPHDSGESVWEYLTPKAKIIHSEPF